jgi:peroxiredoxin
MDRIKFNQLADDIANAYVCSKRGIPNVFIEAFTSENGLEVKHSTISRGISRAVTIIKRNEQARKLSEKLIKS